MEPFTLIIWLWIGERFEEVRVPNLGGEACVEQLFKIQADRSHNAPGKCIGTNGLVLPRTMEMPKPCATGSHDWCGGPLPGRRRV